MCFIRIFKRRRGRECQNPLFLQESYGIPLSAEEYDDSKSEIKMTLFPEDEQVWKSYVNKPTIVVGKVILNICIDKK